MRLNNKEISFKVLRLLVALSFLSGTIGLDLIGARFAHSEPLNLPAINQFVPLSDTYSFPVLKGLRFDPANPLTLEFIVDTADQKDVSQEEASSLIKYFLAALTIPEEEIWVNLSPYEQDRVIPENLGQTDLGKGLLSQDYILKQLTSSLTYPESDTGKDYWDRTYAEVLKIAKTTNLPVSTFNKIWIVPDRAQVYENENIAVISEATLKVMLDEDYLALKNKSADIQKDKKNLDNETIEKINKAASEVMKEVILPQINRDINSGKNFAALRQIYHSLILGIWFKKKFQNSLYAHYINKGMIKGIDLEDKAVKDKIYNHYVEAFKAGLYNYVKTDYDPGSKKNLKRRYYSGGFSLLGDGSGESLSWFQPEEKSPSYIASMLRIGTGGPAQSLAVKLEGSNGPEVVDEQEEVIASAASPISADKKGEGKTFKNAVKQWRETLFVLSSSDSDVETMEGFIRDLSLRIRENPLLRDSGSRAAAIVAFPYSNNLQLFKEASDRLKTSGVSSELARLAVHYAPGIEKTEDAGEFFRKLKDSGVEYIILDSRGQPANDKSLNSALLKAIESELKPIIVVGERGEKDENPYATVVVANQLKVITQGVSAEAIKDTVIAYQPLGLKSFDAGQIVLTHIREIIFQLYGNDAASKVRILYGAENDISSVVNRKSDIDGVFSVRTSSMHGLYSGYHIMEFLQRRLEGGSSSPLASGGTEAQAEKPASSSPASPVRPDGVSGEDSSGRNDKKRRTPIVAIRLPPGNEITTKGAAQFIDEMLKQLIGGGKTLRELEPGNLEVVVLADLSLAHLQAMRDALKASGIPSGLVSLAAQDMPAYGKRHLENLKYLGVEYVAVEASEKMPSIRVRYILQAGMKPIIVVGEARVQEHSYGTAMSDVGRQVLNSLFGIDKNILEYIVIAYQPAGKIPLDKVEEMQRSIRELIRMKFSVKIAGAIRILFGGDVSAADSGFSNLLKADGIIADDRNAPAGGINIANMAKEFLEDREGSSSSPLAQGGAEAQVEKPAVSAASPIGTDREGEERSFENAVKQKREIVIVENWGMDALSEERARLFIYNIIRDITTSPHFNKLDPRNIDIILPVAPSFVHLRAVADEINSAILNYSIPKGLVRLAAQDVSAYEKGRTGEVSAVQLKELGVEYVIVNAHNELANDKVHLALKYSIKPIIAVGETKKQREDRDIVTQIISEQLSNSIAGVPRKTIKDMVIVYQPSESIIPEQAENVQEYIRMLIFQWYGYEAASKIRILYGGGKGYEMGRVDLMPNIDGVFINDAAWMSRGFSVSRKGVDFLLSKRLREGKSGFVSSSPLDSGVKPQANNIASQWRRGGIDMQGIDVGAAAGSSAPLFDSGFDLRNFSGFTFKIVAINEIDDFDSLVSQPRKQEKKLTSIGSPSA